MNLSPRCPICSSHDTLFRFEKRDTDLRTESLYSLYECVSCSIGFVDPQPSADVMASLYEDEFFSKKKRTGVLSTVFGWLENGLFRRRVRLIGRLVAPHCKSVLDVGCGNGKFLRAMRTAGHDVVGIEPSPAGAARAREDHGLDVHCGSVLEIDFGDRRFDLITLWHVLEHVDDPVAYLRHLARWLTPGGRILAAVPNFGGAEAGIYKERWAFLDIPRHLFHFSRRGLRGVAQRAGLHVARDDIRLLEYGVPITVLSFCSLFSGDDYLLLYHYIKRQREYSGTPGFHARLLLILAATGFLFVPLVLFSLLTEACNAQNGLVAVFGPIEDADETN